MGMRKVLGLSWNFDSDMFHFKFAKFVERAKELASFLKAEHLEFARWVV